MSVAGGTAGQGAVAARAARVRRDQPGSPDSESGVSFDFSTSPELGSGAAVAVPRPSAIKRTLTKSAVLQSSATDLAAIDESFHRHRCLWRLSERLCQDSVRRLYRKPVVQWSIALLISGNFVQNCVEKQLDPWNERYPEVWSVMEFVFNVVFLIELVWNMYGSFYITTLSGHFVSSGWNLFDLLVVGFSIPSMLVFLGLGDASGLQGFGMLRMLRAFRILRLFRRIESLNKIIVADAEEDRLQDGEHEVSTQGPGRQRSARSAARRSAQTKGASHGGSALDA